MSCVLLPLISLSIYLPDLSAGFSFRVRVEIERNDPDPKSVETKTVERILEGYELRQPKNGTSHKRALYTVSSAHAKWAEGLHASQPTALTTLTSFNRLEGPAAHN